MGTGPHGDMTLIEHLLQRNAAPADPFNDPDYLAWLEEMERQCGREVLIGAEDGATCTNENCDGNHRGPSPYGDGYVEWRGGGYCAGDPLPVRDLRFTM